ncbi:MAG: Fic family protein, partial [Saprospiraceae bacterium]
MEWKKVIYEEEAISKVLSRIEEKKAILDAKRPIPAIFIHRIKESMSIEWTHHSTGIEGNT